jgi:hypothetical protein
MESFKKGIGKISRMAYISPSFYLIAGAQIEIFVNIYFELWNALRKELEKCAE